MAPCGFRTYLEVLWDSKENSRKYLLKFAKLCLEKGLRFTQEIALQDTSVWVFSYSRDDFFFLFLPTCVLMPFWRRLEIILDDLSGRSFGKEEEDKPLFPPILFICNLAFKETKPPAPSISGEAQ